MITFDLNNPFPLTQIESLSYDDLKNHSALIDSWLGFQCSKIEESIQKQNNLYSENNIWTHIDYQGFQTPYLEIRFILEKISNETNTRLIDIGSAYGRMGIVNYFLPRPFHFTGVELVAERVMEAKRIFQSLGIDANQILQEDVLNGKFDLSNYDVFFCYDFSKQVQIDDLLEKIKKVAAQKKILVVGRGGGIRNSIHRFHPWLCEVNKPTHYSRFSIYKS